MRILHVLRAPVGGLFRHVRDLTAEQAKSGCEVGVLCDASAADSLTQSRLDALKPHLALGLYQTPMPRGLGLGDLQATRITRKLMSDLKVHVVHGHGAKGGAYARLAVGSGKQPEPAPHAFYTPHGGALHYSPKTVQGLVFMALEQRLARTTSGLIFESAFSQEKYRNQVGHPQCRQVVIPNGLLESEFFQHAAQSNATDFLFIGELRHLKGVDILLRALASMPEDRRATATIVGDGPDAQNFKDLRDELGLRDRVTFTGAMPAPEAFAKGRCLVVPSRAESFPYIVLEAAAQAIPMIVTNVGGIPEITGPAIGGQPATQLIEPEDSSALRDACLSFLTEPARFATAAARLQSRAAENFSVQRMTQDVLAFYQTSFNQIATAGSDAQRNAC